MRYVLVEEMPKTTVVDPATGEALKLGDTVEIEHTGSPERLRRIGLAPQVEAPKKSKKGKG